VPHYPESLCVELQPGCNLTCAHCASHGTAELHRECNALGEVDRALLARLAEEVFPYLTSLCILGRGEPLSERGLRLAGKVRHRDGLPTAVSTQA
jgi:pyruvate-formate lyase-activating enzyme